MLYPYVQYAYKVVVNDRLVVYNRPVGQMREREIRTCISIMQKLRAGGLGVNKIIEQTSSDRTFVINMIKILKKEGFVSKPRVSQGKKKEIKLTDFGKKIVALKINVEKYIQARSTLETTVTEKFDLPYLKPSINPYVKKPETTENTLKVVLKNAGWTDKEISRFFYDNFMPPVAIQYLLNDSSLGIIDIVLRKYLIFLELNPSENAKIIIQKIIISLITYLLQFVHVRPSSQGASKVEGILDDISKLSFGYIGRILGFGGFMYHFMIEKVMEMLDSILSVAEPREELIKKSIDHFFDFQKTERVKDIQKHPDRWNADEIFLEESILKAEFFCKNIFMKKHD